MGTTKAQISLHSLISTFVVHCLDSIIPLVSKSKLSSLYLASVARNAGWFESYLVKNPKDSFSRDEAQIIFHKILPANHLIVSSFNCHCALC